MPQCKNENVMKIKNFFLTLYTQSLIAEAGQYMFDRKKTLFQNGLLNITIYKQEL